MMTKGQIVVALHDIHSMTTDELDETAGAALDAMEQYTRLDDPQMAAHAERLFDATCDEWGDRAEAHFAEQYA